MNSRERMIAAVERRTPDRLPTFEWKIAEHLIEAFAPGGDVFDCALAMGHDAVCCSPHYERLQTLSEDCFIDEFGVTRKVSAHNRYPVPIGHPIASLEDFRRYSPPPLDAPGRFRQVDEALRRFGRETAIVVNLHDVFCFPRDLIGFQECILAFYTQPELIREVVGFSVDYNIELARLLKKRGVEFIGIGDDFSDNHGPYVSPETFREFLAPEMKRVVGGFKDLGFYVIKHSDGNLLPILDMVVESGIDCLDPIDPLGGMDIEYIRLQYGDRIARKGNVDCVQILTRGTAAEVERAVRECIRKGAPGGGHIISTSNSLHAGIDPELYRTMLAAIQRYGAYPLFARQEVAKR